MFVFIFLHRFILFYTLYITILKNHGIAPLLISMTMVIHEIAKLISDTHTGAMADKYGIRKIMSVGLCIKAIGITLWIISDTLPFYFIGMFLLGIGRSCTVGKIEVYTYNMLFSLKKEKLFPDIWLGMFMLDGLSATIVGWLSGFLYTIGGFNLGLVFSVFIILMVHAPFVMFIMQDPVIYIRKSATKLPLNLIIKNSLNLIKKNRQIMLLILGAAILPSLFIVFGKFKLFICNDIGMSVPQIANIDSLSHLLQFIFTPIFLLLLKKNKYELTFINNMFLVIFSLVILIIANFWYNMPVLYTIIFFCVIYPTITTSTKNLLERNVPSEVRATISSLTSLLFSFFNILFLMIIGIVAQFFSYQISLFFISFLCLIFVGIVIYLKIDYKNE